MNGSAPSETASHEILDEALATHPAVGSEPREDFAGRLGIHPDRFKMRNLPMEARVWAKALTSSDDPAPFLVYGRPRSGTTLLVRLLNQLPWVRCDGELLHFFLLNPSGFLRRLPRRAGPDMQAYGLKVLSYQLMEIQRIRRPLAFFDRLSGHGYSVVHVTRNTWDQTLSLMKAQTSGIYFSDHTAGTNSLRLDPRRFMDLLGWNEKMLDYEQAVMSHVPHFAICYDRDLREKTRHQQTIDTLCDHLGVASAAVGAATRRTGGEGGLQKVENLEELAAFVHDSDLAHLVPEKLRA